MAESRPVWSVRRSWLVLLGIVATCAFLIAIVPEVHMVQIQSTPGRIKADITVIKEALDAYAMQHDGRYPDTLLHLVTPDEGGHRYLNQTRPPLDPWKREYVYVRCSPPNVLTYGRDGVVGGTGDDADVDYFSVVGETR
jgi:hypothetical protein